MAWTDLSPEEFLKQYGFPKETHQKDMSLEQQVAYLTFNSRKHETEKNELERRLSSAGAPPADYAENKRLAEEFKKYQEQNQTEQEKAIRAARDEGFAAGQKDASASANEWAISTALKSAKNPVLDGLLASGVINAAGFVGADGKPDQAKLDAVLAQFAPPAAGAPAGEQPQGQQAPGQATNQQLNPGVQPGNNAFGGDPGAPNGQGAQPPVAKDDWAAGAEMAKNFLKGNEPIKF